MSDWWVAWFSSHNDLKYYARRAKYQEGRDVWPAHRINHMIDSMQLFVILMDKLGVMPK